MVSAMRLLRVNGDALSFPIVIFATTFFKAVFLLTNFLSLVDSASSSSCDVGLTSSLVSQCELSKSLVK